MKVEEMEKVMETFNKNAEVFERFFEATKPFLHLEPDVFTCMWCAYLDEYMAVHGMPEEDQMQMIIGVASSMLTVHGLEGGIQ